MSTAQFEGIWNDIRIAGRVLRRSPGATGLAVLSIALGIGLTAGIFSLGDAILLRPMPFREPGKLLMLDSRGDDGRSFQYGWLDYLDMTEAGREVVLQKLFWPRKNQSQISPVSIVQLFNPRVSRMN